MPIIDDPRLISLQQKLSPERWSARVAEAERQEAIIERILAQEPERGSMKAAIEAVCPGDVTDTWCRRIRAWKEGGWQALVSRRHVEAAEKLTVEVRSFIRALLSLDPSLRSGELAERVGKSLGVSIGASTVRDFLREAGLAQPPGRPRAAERADELPLAGAELVLAVDDELGAMADLTRQLQCVLESLPAPGGELRDTESNRDDHGRFLPAYNEDQAKGEAAVAPKFRSVEQTRQERDLRAMRTANTSEKAFMRKVQSLTMLPCVSDSPRWSSLRHWRGEHLGTLAGGWAYQPATLEKFLGELKLAGMGEVALEAVGSFWADPAKLGAEPIEGGVVLYGDVTVKPIWTHDFSRCAKVSSLGGRVMPATSTVALHAGCGTPLLYHSHSGHVSLPGEIRGLLRRWEKLAGEGTARRMVVLDREAHAAWLFKELDPDWLYIVPLRSSVTGPKARFEELGEWEPYGEKGDMTREGMLWLNDSRKGEPAIRVRVVARQRHRTGKVAWFATNTAAEDFGPGVMLDLYFRRWPAQEHVFRDGNGRVGLNAHHGYGRQLVTNVAVVDEIEKLQARIGRQQTIFAQATEQAAAVDEKRQLQAEAIASVEARLAELHTDTDQAVASGETTTPRFEDDYEASRLYQEVLPAMKQRAAVLAEEHTQLVAKAEAASDTEVRAATQLERRAGQTNVFTIDVELDQVMTAFKLTFMNLCAYFMAHYLGGKKAQLDTLIRAVLTLPGERVRTRSTETIRIWRQPRDREFMPLVEEACRRLTDKRIMRGKRRLVFELVDKPNE